MVRVRNEHMNSLIRKLKEQKTNEHILNAIIQGIQTWEHQLPVQKQPITVEPFQRRIARAVQAQNIIGWGNMLQGFISHEWGILQAYHY